MRPALTIRLKLLLLVLLASLPALGLAVHSWLSSGRQAMHEAETEARRITRDLAEHQRQLAASTRQFLATVARLPAVRKLDAAACEPLFRELLEANPIYGALVLTSAQGRVLAIGGKVDPRSRGTDLSQAGYFTRALATRDFVVSGYRRSPFTNQNIIVFAHPVLGPDGAPVAVVSCGLPLDRLGAMVRDIQLPSGSTVFMADRDGLRLFNRHYPDPRPEVYPVGQPVTLKTRDLLEQSAGKGPLLAMGSDNRTRLYLVQASTLREDGAPYLYVGVSIPEASILATAREALLRQLSLLGLAAILSAWAAWRVGRGVFVERIERLGAVAASYAAGDFSARSDLPPPLLSNRHDELGELGLAVDRIGEELSRREAERAAVLARLERTQYAVDHAGEEIFWADEEGRLFYVNRSACRSLGWSEEELLGMSVFDVDATATPESWPDTLRLLEGGEPVTFETRHRTRDGRLQDKEVTVSTMSLSGQRMILGSARDIGPRKRQEAVLKSLLDDTARVTGQEFFDALCARLKEVLGVTAVFLGEYLPGAPVMVRTLSYAGDFEAEARRQFPLTESPGCELPADGFLLVPSGASARHPDSPYLRGAGIEGYLGVPLLDRAGAKVGHLSIMNRVPLPEDPAIIGILRLFAQRASAELERLRAEREILASLREKEVLLKEIHHRVKNNMQVVSSLLSLQAQEIGDPAVEKLVAESRARIQSMALVHEDLYQTGNLAQVDFRHYLERLAERVRTGMSCGAGVRFLLELEAVPLSVDQAIPLGLLCNELLTNALKHAFAPGAGGEVRLTLRREEGDVTLCVRDNGRGLPPDFRPGQSQSLGLQLVWALADQLHGAVEAESQGGAVFTLRFPLEEPAPPS